MWIAACDDDQQFAGYLRRTITEIASPDDVCSVYNGGMELLDALRKARRPVDLLLLDMEMPGLTGLETARELHSVSNGTNIVVLSAHTKYALSCYGIRAYHYLVKPVLPQQLKNVIDEIRQKSYPHDVMLIETRDESVFIPYGDILYVESLNRSLFVHTRNNTYKSSRQISELGSELAGKGFYRVHKSYIVNMARVVRVDKSKRKLYLNGGVELPVGNRKQAEFLTALAHYRERPYAVC